MDRIWEKINLKQIGIFFFFTIIFLFEIIRLGDLPGLQMDNVVSDYAAVRYIHPQQYQESHFAEVDNLRLIDTFYHGNLTMLWTLFVTLLTGTTSVLQYRLGTACWGILIIGCTQYILYKISANRQMSFLIMLSMVLAPTTVSTVFTNYYTILPGTAFMLLSFIFQYKWCTQKLTKHLYMAAFFVGLAIYSYFIYAFYFLIFTAVSVYLDLKYLRNDRKNVFCDVIICGAGGVSGAYGYIMGYISLAIGSLQISEEKKIFIFIVTGAILAFYNIFLYRILQKEDKIVQKTLYGVIALLFSLTAFILPMLNPRFRYWFIHKVIESSSMELTFTERIFRIPHLISAYMNNAHREFNILGYRVNKMSFLYRDIYFIITIVWIGWLIYRKVYKKEKSEWMTKCGIVLSVYQYGYCLCSFFIVSGMRPYHYTTFCFVSYILLVIMLSDLIAHFFAEKYTAAVKKIAVILLCIIIAVNYLNTGILTAHIKRTGGHAYYTNQMTELSKEAIKAQAAGRKEFYFFPEWGFHMGFAYLTGNAISFSGYPSYDYIKERISEGYETMIVAYFLKENEKAYLDSLGNYAEKVRKKIWYTLDGDYAFTTLKLDAEQTESEGKE